jgi:hypothetical protein
VWFRSVSAAELERLYVAHLIVWLGPEREGGLASIAMLVNACRVYLVGIVARVC